jgi:hypothetical protein
MAPHFDQHHETHRAAHELNTTSPTEAAVHLAR